MIRPGVENSKVYPIMSRMLFDTKLGFKSKRRAPKPMNKLLSQIFRIIIQLIIVSAHISYDILLYCFRLPNGSSFYWYPNASVFLKIIGFSSSTSYIRI